MPAPDHARRFRRPARAAAILCLGFALLFRTASADEPSPDAKLKSVEEALEQGKQAQARYAQQAEALAGELAGLRKSSVAAAEAAQRHEAALTEIEAQLASLSEQESAKSADLRRRADQYNEVLMALQSLARHPPDSLALSPGEPVDALRSALLLGAAIPQLEAKAKALKDELTALAGLREGIADKRRQLVTESEALAKQQVALKAMIARKASLQEQASRGAAEAGQKLRQLSSDAKDLHDLIEKLEAERRREAEEQRRQAELRARAATRPPRPEGDRAAAPLVSFSADPTRPKGIRPFSTARGAMIMPVSGKIERRFGENDEYGATSKGILFAARPGGQVVAPFDGRIEFAGPFRGYGQILIIEHGDGYHSLLAGLERIEGLVGQWLVAGEPVGTMPSGGRDADLYLELRHHGQPINPLPWLATREDKVSG